jgi:nucleotide-binding universal stress UspA family protein
MFHTVIAGVDGKSNGRDAGVLAGKLVAPGGTLTLVHVHGDETVFRYGSSDFAAIEREDSLALLAGEQRAIGNHAEVATIGATSVGAGLQRIAEERDADLIVVGSSSRGPAGRLLLGDDTRAAVEAAPCAVAVAPTGFAKEPQDFERIGVAYNGGADGDALIALARELAGANRAEISALTVIAIPTYAYGTLAAVSWTAVENDLVREAQQRLDSFGDVDGRSVQGYAAEQLARFADGVDLLLVGSRGYGPARRVLFGSTSAYLTRNAHCPVVVLRRGIEAPVDSGRATAVGATAPR